MRRKGEFGRYERRWLLDALPARPALPAQRMRMDRQVTQPSSFSNSEMSTVTTR